MNRFAIALICFAIFFESQAQIDPLKIEILPPSPNASSLGKFGDIPVGYHTGTPSIDIPIHTLKGRDLTVPISVSYHAGGVRVEEVASWVGLGWTLNAGGAIVRSVRGLPDEGTGGILDHGVTVDQFFQATSLQQQNYFTNVRNGEMDFEPDVYNFNFNGRSGKFFLQKINGIFVGYPVPYSDLKIEYSNGEWTIIDEQGIKYLFGGAFKDETLSITYSSSSRSSHDIRNYVSAWYLKKIISPKGEEVNFDYSMYETSYCQRVGETKYWINEFSSQQCQNRDDSKSYSEIELTGSKLKSIYTASDTIKFVPYETERSDINGDNALKNILIKDNHGAVLRQFDFAYDYFVAVGSPSSTYCVEVNQNSRLYRLRLTSITEKVGTRQLPPYSFQYNNTPMPERLSNSMDHWGFYNGKSNSTLIPFYLYYVDEDTWLEMQGANRRTDPSATLNGILTRITYPTGGYTDFEYESHEAKVPMSTLYQEEAMSYVNTISYASGRCDLSTEVSQPFTVNLPFERNGIKGGYFDVTMLYVGQNPNFGGCIFDGRQGGCGLQVSIPGTAWVPVLNFDGSTSNKIWIPNGNYTLEMERTTSVVDPSKDISITIVGPDPAQFGTVWVEGDTTFYNKKIGGARIKKITSVPGDGSPNSIKHFTYLREEAGSHSSGVLGTIPKYNYTSDGWQTAGQTPITCNYFTRSTSSQIPLATSQGSHVGYEYVQVYDGDNDQNGVTVYRYTSFTQFPDISYAFPFAPNSSFDWRRGLLTTKNTRVKNSTALDDIQITSNQYNFLLLPTDPYYKNFEGIKMACAYTGPQGCSTPVFQRYANNSEFFYLDSETMSTYASGSSVLNTTQQYFYDKIGTHVQLTRQRVTDSEGKVVEYVTKFPFDYQSSASSAISFLKTNHFVAVPIEQQEWRDGKALKGQVNEYEIVNGKPFLKGNYILETATPITNLTQNQQSSLFSDVVPDTRYKPSIQITKNDPATGNILEFKSADNITSSYKWGYDKKFPIAEIKNSNEGNTFYTSFEEDLANISNNAKTGRKSRNSNFTQALSQLSNGTYVLSYWRLQSGQWVFNSQDVNVSNGTYNISISTSTGEVDEVRFQPKNSIMVTYTYDPGIGVTSITDANNNTQYFEYEFNKLRVIKDDKGKILKTYQYHYKNQTN